MSARLQVDALTVGFAAVPVLREVSLQLAAGEWVGLIGPNGSGKSTLMRCIAGMLSPQSGRVRIDGVCMDANPLEARARLGYAVDPATLPVRLSGRQCLDIVAEARALDAVPASTLAAVECLGLAPWIGQPVARYSLGTRQKLAVVLALIGDPPLLLLDEVLNGLDPLAAWALKQLMQERVQAGATVLLATHGLEVAERFLDRALLLLDGRIVADWDAAALAELRARGEGLEGAVVAQMRAAAARHAPV